LDEKFIPSSQVFYNFYILTTLKPLDIIRTEKFSHVPNDVWNKFIKMFYQFYHANPEQTAMEMRKIRETSVHTIQDQIKMLIDLQAQTQDPNLKADYAKIIGTLTNSVSNISSQFTKDLSNLGLMGTKVKGGIAIQIINKIPRPVNPTQMAGTGKAAIDIKTLPPIDVRLLDE